MSRADDGIWCHQRQTAEPLHRLHCKVLPGNPLAHAAAMRHMRQGEKKKQPSNVDAPARPCNTMRRGGAPMDNLQSVKTVGELRAALAKFDAEAFFGGSVTVGKLKAAIVTLDEDLQITFDRSESGQPRLIIHHD